MHVTINPKCKNSKREIKEPALTCWLMAAESAGISLETGSSLTAAVARICVER